MAQHSLLSPSAADVALADARTAARDARVAAAALDAAAFAKAKTKGAA